MHLRSTIVGVVTAMLVAAVAGCGGSAGLSRAQIVTKANAICASAVTAGRAITPPAEGSDEAATAAYFNRVLPITTAATHRLEALKPDKAVASDWNAYVATRRTGLRLLQTITHDADTNSANASTDLAKAPAVQATIVAAATKLGAKTCAQ